MKELMKSVLSQFECISSISDYCATKVEKGKAYEQIIRFKVEVENVIFNLIVGIPETWDTLLVDFYVENTSDIPFIPHIDRHGAVCTFDKEGIFIDKTNPRQVMFECVVRLIEVLSKGLKGENKADFIREFECYWSELKDFCECKLSINTANKGIIKKIHFVRISTGKYVVSDSDETFKLYSSRASVVNAAYVRIELKEYVYPPDWRKGINEEFFYKLLMDNNVNVSAIQGILSSGMKDKLIVIDLVQPDKTECFIGCVITLKKYIAQNPILVSEAERGKISAYYKMHPLNVTCIDRKYLLNRGGAKILEDKKVLLIGCGSVGGYILPELIKSGIKNVTIVDNDKLKEENIFRHYLGMQYIGMYKSVALSQCMQLNYPGVNVKSCEELIRNAIEDESIVLHDYDVIISATGNPNVNLWLTEYMHLKTIDVPVIYTWNEALGIGSHALILKDLKGGCLECLFKRNEDGMVYDRSSFAEAGQIFVKNLTGCGSSFIPYASLDSIRTAILAAREVLNVLEGRTKENLLISLKGDKQQFEEQGYKVSKRYDIDKERIVLCGSQFRNSSCRCCGGGRSGDKSKN